MKNFQVFGDRICVKKNFSTQKKDGILMPTMQAQDEPMQGVIISVASGIDEKYSAALKLLNQDDIVLFQVFNAVPMRADGDMYYILHIKDVLAKV